MAHNGLADKTLPLPLLMRQIAISGNQTFPLRYYCPQRSLSDLVESFIPAPAFASSGITNATPAIRNLQLLIGWAETATAVAWLAPIL